MASNYHLTNPPVLLSPTKRRFPQGHSRSPSRSPTRSPTRPRFTEDLLSNLTPATTLELFRNASGALKASIEAAAPSQRSFGVRAALASKNIHEWAEELSAWPWPSAGSEGFEIPAPKRRKIVAERGASGYGYGTEDGDGEEYWGSLPAEDVLAYEARIDEIAEDMEDLDVEEIKGRILDSHTLPRSRGSTPYDGEESKIVSMPVYTRMEDFTAVITATVLNALPKLAKLNRLMDVWSIRLAVLRDIPPLMLALDDAEVAMRSGWKALDVVPDSKSPKLLKDSLTTTFALSRQNYETIKSILQTKVTELGQKIDQILDALEGSADTIPDAWLDRMEGTEKNYGEWVVRGDQKVREGEWARARRKAQALELERIATQVSGASSVDESLAIQKEHAISVAPFPAAEAPEAAYHDEENAEARGRTKTKSATRKDRSPSADAKVPKNMPTLHNSADGDLDKTVPIMETVDNTKQAVNESSSTKANEQSKKPSSDKTADSVSLAPFNSENPQGLPTLNDRSVARGPATDASLVDGVPSESEDAVNSVTKEIVLPDSIGSDAVGHVDRDVVGNIHSEMPLGILSSGNRVINSPDLEKERDSADTLPRANLAILQYPSTSSFSFPPPSPTREEYKTPSIRPINTPEQPFANSLPNEQHGPISESPSQISRKDMEVAVHSPSPVNGERSIAAGRPTAIPLSQKIRTESQITSLTNVSPMPILSPTITTPAVEKSASPPSSSAHLFEGRLSETLRKDDPILKRPEGIVEVDEDRSSTVLDGHNEVEQEKGENTLNLVPSESISERDNLPMARIVGSQNTSLVQASAEQISQIIKPADVKPPTIQTSTPIAIEPGTDGDKIGRSETAPLPRPILAPLADPSKQHSRVSSFASSFTGYSTSGSSPEILEAEPAAYFRPVTTPSHSPENSFSGSPSMGGSIPEAFLSRVATPTRIIDLPARRRSIGTGLVEFENRPRGHSDPFQSADSSLIDDGTAGLMRNSAATPIDRERTPVPRTLNNRPNNEIYSDSTSSTSPLSRNGTPSTINVARRASMDKIRPGTPKLVEVSPHKRADSQSSDHSTLRRGSSPIEGFDPVNPRFRRHSSISEHHTPVSVKTAEKIPSETTRPMTPRLSGGQSSSSDYSIFRKTSREIVTPIKSPSRNHADFAKPSADELNTVFPNDKEDISTVRRLGGSQDTSQDISSLPKLQDMFEEESTPIQVQQFQDDDQMSEAPAILQEAPVLSNVSVTAVPPTPGPAIDFSSMSSDSQLQHQISQILNSIPARIHLSSAPSEPPEPVNKNKNGKDQGRETRNLSSSLQVKKRNLTPSTNYRSTSSQSVSRDISRSNTPTPSFTLSPAYPSFLRTSSHNPHFNSHTTPQSNIRTRSTPSNPEIKLYHLSRAGGGHEPGSANEAPIKLFVRLVGENGERVMVRVGGGWADLGEYLREYAAHHGRRVASTPSGTGGAGRDRVEVADGPFGQPRMVSGGSYLGRDGRSSAMGSSRRESFLSSFGSGNGRASPRPSRPSSALGRPLSSLAIRKRRPSGIGGDEAADPKTPMEKFKRSGSSLSGFFGGNREKAPNETTSVTQSSLSQSQTRSRSSSNMSWGVESDGGFGASTSSNGAASNYNSPEKELGLAGPKPSNKRTETGLNEESKAWVESMKERVRIASAEKERERANTRIKEEKRREGEKERGRESAGGFGKLGKVGTTRRLFGKGF